jgi:hypothetical protein
MSCSNRDSALPSLASRMPDPGRRALHRSPPMRSSCVPSSFFVPLPPRIAKLLVCVRSAPMSSPKVSLPKAPNDPKMIRGERRVLPQIFHSTPTARSLRLARLWPAKMLGTSPTLSCIPQCPAHSGPPGTTSVRASPRSPATMDRFHAPSLSPRYPLPVYQARTESLHTSDVPLRNWD